MKKVIYGTLAFFIAVLIIVMIIASHIPVQMVKYENGRIVEETK